MPNPEDPKLASEPTDSVQAAATLGNESIARRGDFSSFYGPDDSDLDCRIRSLVFDLDIGQRSWALAQDIVDYIKLLELSRKSLLVDIGCGFGATVDFVAKLVGCHCIGLDINPKAVDYANDRFGGEKDARLRFVQTSPTEALPIPDASVDAILMNDMICHVADRPALLRECHRILKPGKKMVVTDPLVLTGPIENYEVEARNMAVSYHYVPYPTNEVFFQHSGFRLLSVENSTQRLVELAAKELEVRAMFWGEVVAQDGLERALRVNEQLKCVFKTANESRLSRFTYFVQKPD